MERAQFTLQQTIPSLKGGSHRKNLERVRRAEDSTHLSLLRRAELVRKIYA